MIHRVRSHARVVFTLSGRMEARHVEELQALFMVEHLHITLDLNELKLVDQAAVKFLGHCESVGIDLENCPAYIREWIMREREAG